MARARTKGRRHRLSRISRQAGGQAVANFADVSTMDGGESVIKTALDTYGKLDGLINLAAILRDRMIFNLSEQEWDDVIRIDLKGHFTTIKPASIVMRQQRYGRIVNYSSVSGLQGNSGQANYGAAKAGVGGLTRVAARDLGRYGVTVNAIAPGASTRLTATVPDSARQLRASRGIAGAGGASATTVMANRAAEEAAGMRGADMVAPMTIYLLLDEAWNINGKIFQVAGGAVGLLNEQYPPIRNIYKHGRWTLDELRMLVPTQLMPGIANPRRQPTISRFPAAANQFAAAAPFPRWQERPEEGTAAALFLSRYAFVLLFGGFVTLFKRPPRTLPIKY